MNECARRRAFFVFGYEFGRSLIVRLRTRLTQWGGKKEKASAAKRPTPPCFEPLTSGIGVLALRPAPRMGTGSTSPGTVSGIRSATSAILGPQRGPIKRFNRRSSKHRLVSSPPKAADPQSGLKDCSTPG